MTTGNGGIKTVYDIFSVTVYSKIFPMIKLKVFLTKRNSKFSPELMLMK